MIRFGDIVLGIPSTFALTGIDNGDNFAHNLGELISIAKFYDASGVDITENSFTNVDSDNITLHIAQGEGVTTTFTGTLILFPR